MLILSAIKIFNDNYSVEFLTHVVLQVTDGSHFYLNKNVNLKVCETDRWGDIAKPQWIVIGLYVTEIYI